MATKSDPVHDVGTGQVVGFVNFPDWSSASLTENDLASKCPGIHGSWGKFASEERPSVLKKILLHDTCLGRKQSTTRFLHMCSHLMTPTKDTPVSGIGQDIVDLDAGQSHLQSKQAS